MSAQNFTIVAFVEITCICSGRDYTYQWFSETTDTYNTMATFYSGNWVGTLCTCVFEDSETRQVIHMVSSIFCIFIQRKAGQKTAFSWTLPSSLIRVGKS